jgi:S1-C subfamily serine protease
MRTIKPFLYFIISFTCILLLIPLMATITSCAFQDTRAKIIKKEFNSQFEPHSSIKKTYNSSLTVAMLLNDPKLKKERPKFRHIGSATIVSCKKNRKIIAFTCFHVIKDFLEKKEDQRYVYLINQLSKRSVVTKIAVIKPKWDLAILEGIKLEKEDCPYVSLSKTEPAVGENVFIIGSPRSRRHEVAERTVTYGILSNKFTKDLIITYRTDAVVFYGNSGGGLFNTKQELIGTISRIEVSPMGLGGIIVPASNEAIGLPSMRKILQIYYRNQYVSKKE